MSDTSLVLIDMAKVLDRPALLLSLRLLSDLLGAWNEFPCRFHGSQHFHFVVGVQCQTDVEMSFDIVR